MRARLRSQGFINHHRKKIFTGFSILLVSYLLFFPAIPMPQSLVMAFHLCGILLVAAGCLLRVLCTISIGGHKNLRIVTTEVYSVCRNPLYFSSFLMAAGLGLFTARLDFALVCTAAFLAIFLPMMRNEARYLRERFPEYATYESVVPLFLPNLFLWRSRERFEVSYQLILRTTRDASVLLLLLPMLCYFDGLHD